MSFVSTTDLIPTRGDDDLAGLSLAVLLGLDPSICRRGYHIEHLPSAADRWIESEDDGPRMMVVDQDREVIIFAVWYDGPTSPLSLLDATLVG
jgi:hypothetical protein